MKVTNDYNPYAHQQQRMNPKRTGSADMPNGSVNDKNGSFDSMLFSSVNNASQNKETLPFEAGTGNALFGNASDNVKDAWAKTENETGYNPLVSTDGKIVGSSLLAKHMEMEYNLMLRYGDKEARAMMSNVFSNTESAKSLVQSALERANNPLSNDKDKEQLEKEINFFELFLSHL